MLSCKVQISFIKQDLTGICLDGDLPFTEHIEEYIDVDGEEDEKVKTFSTVLHRHSQQPGPG